MGNKIQKSADVAIPEDDRMEEESGKDHESSGFENRASYSLEYKGLYFPK